MKSCLIFAYYSYRDPIFQSAVLPYFVDLNPHLNMRLVLLTFEKPEYRLSPEERRSTQKYLAARNIHWYSLGWHSGNLKLLKKAYDFFAALFIGLLLVIKYRVSVIYSEGFPGAVIGHFLARLTLRRHVVHSFEPHADASLESGLWTARSWEYRLLKYFEVLVARHCSHVLTGTKAYIEKLQPLAPDTCFLRVPSCIDLDHFQFSEESRRKIRQESGILESDILLVYLGKFDGIYWSLEEFARFCEACRTVSERFRFLVLTPETPNLVESQLLWLQVPPSLLTVRQLSRQFVPAYLSAADFGLCCVRQLPSKRYCSPIKNGEYWAMGLPVLIPEGISDDHLYAIENRIGLSVPGISPQELSSAAERIAEWFDDPTCQPDLVRQRAREFVEKDRDVRAYGQLYLSVLQGKPVKGLEKRELVFIKWAGPQTNYLETLFLPALIHLTNQGFKVQVIHLSWGHTKARNDRISLLCSSNGIEYHYIEVHRKRLLIGIPLSLFKAVWKFRSLKLKDPVVWPRSIIPAAITLLISCLFPRLTVVYDSDGLPVDERREFASSNFLASTLYGLVERLILRKASAILTRTAFACRVLERRAPKSQRSRVVTVTNGRDENEFKVIDLQVRPSLRKKWGLPIEGHLIVYAGSVGPQYSFELLNSLAVELAARSTPATVIFLTTEVEKFEALLTDVLVDTNCLLLSPKVEDIPELLGVCDLGFCCRQPSLSMEGVQPLKLGEYLLCGLPPIFNAWSEYARSLPLTKIGFCLDDQRVYDEIAVYLASPEDHEDRRQQCRQFGLDTFSLAVGNASYTRALESTGLL